MKHLKRLGGGFILLICMSVILAIFISIIAGIDYLIRTGQWQIPTIIIGMICVSYFLGWLSNAENI